MDASFPPLEKSLKSSKKNENKNANAVFTAKSETSVSLKHNIGGKAAKEREGPESPGGLGGHPQLQS